MPPAWPASTIRPASQSIRSTGVSPTSPSRNSAYRLPAASERTDDRISLGYMFARPVKGNKHRLRFGGDYRRDVSTSLVNSDARGTFLFTGLYTSNGQQASITTGSDFADFLLGLPQQASLQVGGETKLRQHSWSAFVEDNWQQSSRLTLNLGLRYELALPYVEVNGRMANLDVTPAFTNAAVVTPGASGPYTGEFPAGLVGTDWGNVGPRIGVAYRLAHNTVVRGGYSITYNNSSYATIARQLVGQPPWAETQTNIGSIEDPLSISRRTCDGQRHHDEQLRRGQKLWSRTDPDLECHADPGPAAQLHGRRRLHRHERNEPRSAAGAESKPRWFAAHSRRPGVHLGVVRRTLDAAARELPAEASAREGTWCGPELHPLEVDGQRLVTRGGRSGRGAERSRSRRRSGRCRISINGTTWAPTCITSCRSELDRKSLVNGGRLAALVGDWTVDMAFTAHSGSPFTARVVNATSSVANGTSGSLRADAPAATAATVRSHAARLLQHGRICDSCDGPLRHGAEELHHRPRRICDQRRDFRVTSG